VARLELLGAMCSENSLACATVANWLFNRNTAVVSGDDSCVSVFLWRGLREYQQAIALKEQGMRDRQVICKKSILFANCPKGFQQRVGITGDRPSDPPAIILMNLPLTRSTPNYRKYGI